MFFFNLNCDVFERFIGYFCVLNSIVEKNARGLSSMDNERASLDNVFEEETKSPALKRISTSSYGSELDPAGLFIDSFYISVFLSVCVS